MAEDATASESRPSDAPLIVDDGNSNTIVFLEDDSRDPNISQEGGASPAPASPGLTVVVAERDPATGDVTLSQGKSTEGDGRIQIAGTDRIFEDQAAFENFLAEVNAKADAGVPFEDIIGSDVNAIPVIENGVATGATLGGIEVGPAPGEVVQIGPPPPADGGNPGASPDPVQADGSAGGAFSNEPDRSGRDPDVRDPDSPADGVPPTPSADGNAANGAFPDRNQNGINDSFETAVPTEREEPVPAAPAADDRQPGRDENGNLLPGADGQVTLDDFNRINDLDGNGINDGAENPVDLSGDVQTGQPIAEPPPLQPLDPPTPAFETPDQPFEPGRDETPEPPPHAPEPPVVGEDPVLPGDGFAVIDEPPAAVVDAPPAGPVNIPPVHSAEIPPVVDVPPAPIPPPHATVVTQGSVPPVPQPDIASTDAAPPATASADAPAHAAVAPVAATTAPSPAAALDNFSHGTAPSAASPIQAPAEPQVTFGEPPHEDAEVANTVTQAEAQQYPPEASSEVSDPPIAIGVGLAGTEPPRSATDVFDQATAGAAVSVGERSEDGGGNLLERILDKVKDVLFDSGSADASPVQLPVQPQAVQPELPATEAVAEAEPIALAGQDEPLPEDTIEDGL